MAMACLSNLLFRVFGLVCSDTFLILQAGPLDYFTKKFYINRKETVDLHLQWISTASSQVSAEQNVYT